MTSTKKQSPQAATHSALNQSKASTMNSTPHPNAAHPASTSTSDPATGPETDELCQTTAQRCCKTPANLTDMNASAPRDQRDEPAPTTKKPRPPCPTTVQGNPVELRSWSDATDSDRRYIRREVALWMEDFPEHLDDVARRGEYFQLPGCWKGRCLWCWKVRRTCFVSAEEVQEIIDHMVYADGSDYPRYVDDPKAYKEYFGYNDGPDHLNEEEFGPDEDSDEGEDMGQDEYDPWEGEDCGQDDYDPSGGEDMGQDEYDPWQGEDMGQDEYDPSGGEHDDGEMDGQ